MVQYAYPDDDPTPGNWSASSGSDRHLMIDDAYGTAQATADNTYITVTDNWGGAEAITLSLSSVDDPESASDHSVVVLWSEDSGGMESVTLNVHLKDGSTSIKNENFTSSSIGNSTMTLNSSQANSISGYNNLTLILTATDGMGMGTSTYVYQAYFACPDAEEAEVTANPAFLLFLD